MVLECAGMVPDGRSESPSAPPKGNSVKDASKKKKVNRTAKLKQCKLDARREQWLSQGKNKVIGQQQHPEDQQNGNTVNHNNNNGGTRATANSGEDDHNVAQAEQVDTPRRSFSDMDSRSSKASVEEEEYDNSSEDMNSKSQTHDSSQEEEEEEEEDGSLDDNVEDDWEAAADALNIAESPPKPVKDETQCIPYENNNTDSSNNDNRTPFSIEEGILKPEYKIKSTSPSIRSPRMLGNNGRAWRPDDSSRPNTLPKLTKLHSFPSQSCRPWSSWNTNHNNPPALSIPAPLSCPICYEDLDVTDFNFVPCSCGFRLCLFCHKRILEQDARCPGCRNQYNATDTMSAKVATVRLPRSCSMRLKV